MLLHDSEEVPVHSLYYKHCCDWPGSPSLGQITEEELPQLFVLVALDACVMNCAAGARLCSRRKEIK
eukprot:2846815-Amphidinium_carterae.1